jgi:uncharacterized protein YjiS (DUF1127 family)
MPKTMIPATALRSTSSFGRDLNLIGPLAQAPSQVFGTLLVWRMRASQRARLAEMESHRLQDIGITPTEAKREAAKPFWRA